MATQVLSFSRPALGRRTLIGAGALALIATLGLSQIGRPDYTPLAANREVEMHVARVPIADLAELSKQSDAVVVGRVLAKGQTKMINAEGQQPAPFVALPAPSGLSAEKAAELKKAPAAPVRSNEGIITPPSGIPVTEYTVEVTRAMSGKLKKGEKITLSQIGGEIKIPLGQGAPTLTRTMIAEHDKLLVAGQEQVFFLSRGADGTFSTVGGPEGRFDIDARRNVQPVDAESPVGKAHKGLSLDSLETKTKSLRGV
jgi:hypothetical protein